MSDDVRKGVLLALSTALISGVSIYVNKFGVRAVGDPLLFTTVKNSMVGFLFMTGIVVLGARAGRAPLSRKCSLGLLGLALLGGSVPFLLFFQGLSLASAPSAAILHKSLFLWVALLAVPFLGERHGHWTLAGLAVLALGQMLANWPAAWGWGLGESLILLATLLWALETIIARKLLPDIPVIWAGAARMAGGSLVMWTVLVLVGRGVGLAALTPLAWTWILVTAVLLIGYVGTWYAALKWAPATIVTSILTLGAVITAALNILVAQSALPGGQLLGLGAMLLGVLILLRWSRLVRGEVHYAN